MTGKDVKPKTTEERVEALEEAVTTVLDMLEQISKKMGDLDKRTVKKATGLFGGKRTKTAIKDTTTGKIYPSKAATGKELFKEVENGDPADHFLWYKLIAKFPDRFVDASAEEAESVWAEEKAKLEAEVEEANKKIEAEEKAKAAAEAKGKK